MADKFKNKYRIPSSRLQTWDYAANGLYFVTICTANREHFFGDIKTADFEEINSNSTPYLKLSEMGQIAEKYWYEIPEHFPFVKLEAFVIMPNHVHGIIVIDNTDDGIAKKSSDSKKNEINNSDTTPHAVQTPDSGVSACAMGTDLASSNTKSTQTAAASEKWKPGTLGVIINQYKRIVTIKSREIHADFGWQSRFHDHIIRDAGSFERIRNYIINNPQKWIEDKFYT
ncbi:transposase [Lacihabitans lacunae]|uniref:Transposase n=1 Tax=Lacihabitans lacunae TaxID=1028214 RepID=A0ABV7YQ96_9BACT